MASLVAAAPHLAIRSLRDVTGLKAVAGRQPRLVARVRGEHARRHLIPGAGRGHVQMIFYGGVKCVLDRQLSFPHTSTFTPSLAYHLTPRSLTHFVSTRLHTLSCAMSPRSAYCGLKQPP